MLSASSINQEVWDDTELPSGNLTLGPSPYSVNPECHPIRPNNHARAFAAAFAEKISKKLLFYCATSRCSSC